MYEENVRRGMQLLDHVIPDWLWRVNVNELCISSCYFCVLGQLGCEEFVLSKDATPFGYMAKVLELSDKSLDDHGFAINQASFEYRDFDKLTATWRRLILEAREQRKLTLASQPLEAETERVLAVAN